jgi:gamma-glutamyltranspeptidase/glutathione hydrolase
MGDTMKPTSIQAKAMVATSVPRASSIGLDVLKRGGNAVDAAIAVAAALTVLEPTSNGIGGDCFAIVWHQGSLYGMNASGPAPKRLSRDALLARGIDSIPAHGWIPVTVPGAVRGWAALHERFGALPFAECLNDAVRVAREGYPVSPTVAKYWDRAVKSANQRYDHPSFQAWFDTFAPQHRAPAAGERVVLTHHAETLQVIADTLGESFYNGALADAILKASDAGEGFLSAADLAEFDVEWVEPIQTKFCEHDVCELPPNGQGIVALEALGILNRLYHSDPNVRLHRRIEAIKLAFSDAFAFVADPRKRDVPFARLLEEEYLTTRRAHIDELAKLPYPGKPTSSGTVYFAVADEQGTMVSFIQSNYMGFGSGIVVPNTGIALHNRGHNFSMTKGHPNVLEGGKRPYHTIIPGFLMKDGQPVGPFGVMGGFMQPQGHVQVLASLFEDGCSLQEAFDRPRWMWTEGLRVSVEPTFPAASIDDLKRRGHIVQIEPDEGWFGRGQAIFRDPLTLRYDGATDKRCDGFLAWY